MDHADQSTQNLTEELLNPSKQNNRKLSYGQSILSDDDMQFYNISKDSDVGSKVIKKLVMVSIVAFILMGAEVAGGYLAQSLAIMTDAAHMFSDFCGFFISIFSIWIARRPSTRTHSYGFHRAEIIGALASVIIIWALTIWLVIEAINRIVYQDFEIDADIMLYTSIFALCSNLVMMKVLHGGHGHSHGGHGHSHGGETKKKTKKHGHSHEGHGHSHEGHGHSHEAHGHSHGGHGHSHGGHGHSHGGHGHSHGGHVHTEDSENPCLDSQIIDDQQVFVNDKPSCDSPKASKIITSEKSKKIDMKKSKNLSVIQDSENANMRAAMIHLLGDLIQSVGVVIASIVVKFNPTWKLCDPICTIVFAIIVLFTTTNVVKDCIRVLMEASPNGIDIQEFEQQLMSLEHVKDIHDIHIWSLSHGKPAMSAHIYSTKPGSTLKRATTICRQYGIYHSTIQVELWKPDTDFDFCKQNVH